MPMRTEFAHRLRAREVLVGTFIKSRDPAIVEVLGGVGFDFVILDAEHAPFDRADVALMAMASRAARLPLLVRVPVADGGWIATVLDAGAAGVMVPQVSGAKMAQTLVRAIRYGPGGRGFSPSTPAAEYGARGIKAHLDRQQRETVLICQIEDRVSVSEAGRIAAVDGVDALLLGPIDLTVSLGQTDPLAPEVATLCRNTIAAGTAELKAAGLFLTNLSESAAWQSVGASLFVLGSDQAFLSQAAKSALDQFRLGS
jgi:2-keto-3-deoxy-L-rhamnonate aldolase RhmA